MIIRDNRKRKCMLIDVANPGDRNVIKEEAKKILTLRLLMSYIYGAPSKARNANVVYIWTYVWQR